ncbi:MAG: MMPL family transporter [Saprospiraceae bacterium]|nr:MMPL family transporter [Saprospiraceae bacterium]
MSNRTRILILALFAIISMVATYGVFNLTFTFDFEQFFPEGDDDLNFFQEFVDEFETDDNFLLVGIERKDGVFDQTFLKDVHDFTLSSRDLPHVRAVESLTKFEYPVKTPFAVTSVPAIHIDDPERYAADRERLLQDDRFVYNLINIDATALVVYIKVVERIQLEQARELMNALEDKLSTYSFDDYHYLGRPYFQKELVAMQKREVLMSAVVSGILVTIIMFVLFRRPWGIGLALFSIGLGMLLFMGFLGVSGRPLNAMAALYPVLMIIVGTSDVVHIMSKYIDELRKGNNRKDAIRVTIREIGIATLLTSITTAIGFGSLLTSRVSPIRDFGMNAAIGVLIAYFTVILFTTAVMSWFRQDQIMKVGKGQQFWEKLMRWTYNLTRLYPRRIALGGVVFMGISFLGISMISTNYDIIDNMPRNRKITDDFLFFEQELAGFRPMEFAIYAQEGYLATDYEVVEQMGKIEEYLAQYPYVKAVNSITAVYKSINQMNAGNNPEAYILPPTKERFERYKRLVRSIPQLDMNILVSKDQKMARITSRVDDIGADSIKYFGERFDLWAEANLNGSVVSVKRTGTGLIIDKNAEYIRRNLIQGLGMAIVIVSILMAILFRNTRMLLISLVPNVFPLLLAGALLGFLGIELEAGVSIVFAVVFGIAVDDTIHFLSKYKLARNKGLSVEKALEITFTETGKAIVLTSIILFFGFLVMLFSIHPPSVVVGLLISLTLLSALISDLLLIPVLIRWLMPDKDVKSSEALVNTSDSTLAEV